MAENETEEEQLKAIKEWWQENGRSVVAGIVIGVGALVGWKGWDSYQERQALEASDLYNAMQASVLAQDIEAVAVQAQSLKDSYSSTPYASLSALLLAKTSIETDDNQKAIENLEWVISHSKQETIQAIAKLRLARLYVFQDMPDQAEKLLDEDYPIAFLSLQNEILGDLHMTRGDNNAARNAYNAAISTADDEDIEYLKMKRDSTSSKG